MKYWELPKKKNVTRQITKIENKLDGEGAHSTGGCTQKLLPELNHEGLPDIQQASTTGRKAFQAGRRVWTLEPKVQKCDLKESSSIRNLYVACLGWNWNVMKHKESGMENTVRKVVRNHVMNQGGRCWVLVRWLNLHYFSFWKTLLFFYLNVKNFSYSSVRTLDTLNTVIFALQILFKL